MKLGQLHGEHEADLLHTTVVLQHPHHLQRYGGIVALHLHGLLVAGATASLEGAGEAAAASFRVLKLEGDGDPVDDAGHFSLQAGERRLRHEGNGEVGVVALVEDAALAVCSAASDLDIVQVD